MNCPPPKPNPSRARVSPLYVAAAACSGIGAGILSFGNVHWWTVPGCALVVVAVLLAYIAGICYGSGQ